MTTRNGKSHNGNGHKKPNVLMIFGDDVGQTNISAYSHGMMGYRTPNIDRIAHEGMLFTDYSNTYWDWMINHAYLCIPAQQMVGKFLSTFREFPPRQKAASFTVDQVMEKLTAGIGSK